MRNYTINRLIQMIPSLILISLAVFLLHRFLPGDVLYALESDLEGEAYDREKVLALFGLDKPAHEAYLDWFFGVLRGDLGHSFLSRTPVLEEISWRWPVTVELAVLSIIFTIAIGIPLGVITAVKSETMSDYFLRSWAVLGLSLPTFWIGLMVIMIPAVYFGWLPRQDYVPFTEDPIRNLGMFILPSFIMSIHDTARTMRMTRATMLEVLRQDYIRTAWAKGLGSIRVYARHASKNAMIPVVTLLGLDFVNTLGGTVIIETVFDLPGIGHYTLQALRFRDYTAVQSLIFVYAALVVVANLLIDLSYGLLDPRIRFS